MTNEITESEIVLKLYTKKGETMQLYDDFGINYNDVHYKCIFREIEDYDNVLAENISLNKKNEKLQKRNDELEKSIKFITETNDDLKEHHQLLKNKLNTGRWIKVQRTGFEKVFIGPDV